MSLLAIPNVSAGVDVAGVRRLTRALEGSGARLLDVHSDPIHNRTVFTAHGDRQDLIAAMADLAVAARNTIDLTKHGGVHPRLGVLDVCPFVPLRDENLPIAVEAATQAGGAIADRSALPVFLYGAAASRSETAELPDLRRGGLAGLIGRGLAPDFGPNEIDLTTGVVCVGARLPLIAFNVWLRTNVETAREVARTIRSSSGGLPGVRALGLPISDGISQISMNLVDPATTGIDAVFHAIERQLDPGLITRTEVVGLIPDRYLPDPDAPAARLMIPPGRSLGSVIR